MYVIGNIYHYTTTSQDYRGPTPSGSDAAAGGWAEGGSGFAGIETALRGGATPDSRLTDPSEVDSSTLVPGLRSDIPRSQFEDGRSDVDRLD